MAAALSPSENEERNHSLLQRCRLDDPGACNELLRMYNRKIFNTAYRILGEEASAEDALQETMLNVYRGLRSFRGDSKFSTWVSRITVNVCLGILRKGRNRQYVDLEDESVTHLPSESSPRVDPLEYTKRQELRSIIHETFRRMSTKQGVVVRLHDMEGNTIQEIARIVGVPAGTVKSRLFYGRQEFKEIFSSLMRRGLEPETVH